MGDRPGGGSHIGGGLGQTQAVAHSGGDIVGIGHMGWGSSIGGGGNTNGGSSIGTGGVGVGEGSVKEDLGLGGGGGKSENNLRGGEQ